MDVKRIEIDLEVHKEIESRRRSFGQTQNDILRDLLGLGTADEKTTNTMGETGPVWRYKNIPFPVGLELRSQYNRVNHTALVVEHGIEYKGEVFTSPSGAAVEAAGNSVNGWRFWSYYDKGAGRWKSIDSLRR